jgi:hypothetical protein
VLIVDTGVLLAATDAADPDHHACGRLLATETGRLVTTALVIAETAYLIDRQLGPTAEADFFRAIADGEITLERLSSDDYGRIAELIEQYADLPLGGTDASLVAIAERLGVDTVATLDRRHFSVVRPKHTAAFTLLP